mmetsp:Transcript_44960/g.141536  ORF Transcript_44960/g.141536 Transcript_44960/m.141536 type:complete len:437 (-) Transcript_44960:176-1486(-)
MIGGKRPRTSIQDDASVNKHLDMDTKKYLEELEYELERHRSKNEAERLPHSERLLLDEIDRVRQHLDASPEVPPWTAHEGEGISSVLESEEEISAGDVRAILKVFVPEECYGTTFHGDVRGGTSRGRLLGPSGQTIRWLQQESGCKIQLKGKNSLKLRDGQTWESLAEDPQHAHVLEDFHVWIQYEGPRERMAATFSKVLLLVKKIIHGEIVQPPSMGMSGSIGMSGSMGMALHEPQMKGSSMSSGYNDYSAGGMGPGSPPMFNTQVVHNREFGSLCRTSIKIFIPQKTPMGCSRGKLLGTRGSMLKQLMHETGCHLALRGRGSMKEDRDGDAKGANSEGELHVLADYEGPIAARDGALQNVVSLVRAVLTPANDLMTGQHCISQYEALVQGSMTPRMFGGNPSVRSSMSSGPMQQFSGMQMPFFDQGYDVFMSRF